MSSLKWSEIVGWDAEALEDLRYLGFAYLKQGKFDIAQSFFEALVTFNQNDAYDLQTLGGLYLETGHNLQALSTIEQALKIEPGHPMTLLNRAKALFALGYRRQAIAQAKTLVGHSDATIANQASALLLSYT
ncbi:MAG TPA: type III secretion chaperone [Rhabdochlamydiaceae bacterium]|jgi:tetratricopeptide (TPR) repeat protein|nr:type III secretion chaperone [Rhabdochlamydiaceae bacterium]